MASLDGSRRIAPYLLGWIAIVWVLAAIDPFDRRDWLLENLLVFVTVGVLAATYRRFTFSNLSYFLLAIFLTLHLVGSHYTYAEVPAGFWVQDALGLSRNHYDRVVHFLFGLLLAWPMRELLLRAAAVRPGWSFLLAVTCIMAMSSLYEVIEGIVAMIVSPELGSAYLGTQGDEWDAQKDSALACLGAVLAMVFAYRLDRS